jgi:hypothetical protein
VIYANSTFWFEITMAHANAPARGIGRMSPMAESLPRV